MKISRSKAQQILDNMLSEYKECRHKYKGEKYWVDRYWERVEELPDLKPEAWLLGEVKMKEYKARMAELRPKILKLQRALGLRN